MEHPMPIDAAPSTQGGLANQLIEAVGGVDEEDHVWVIFLDDALFRFHWLGQ
jgi:hypothetical protein